MSARVDVPMTLFHAMAVHGNLCLALRHPENTGPSTAIVEEVLGLLEELLLQTGVLSEDLIAQIRRQQHAERPRIILARG